jgi:hypothetical protein
MISAGLLSGPLMFIGHTGKTAAYFVDIVYKTGD